MNVLELREIQTQPASKDNQDKLIIEILRLREVIKDIVSTPDSMAAIKTRAQRALICTGK